MLSILLLWTPSLKYFSKFKGEYKNLESGSGTSEGPSLLLYFHKRSQQKVFNGLFRIEYTTAELVQLSAASISLRSDKLGDKLSLSD